MTEPLNRGQIRDFAARCRAWREEFGVDYQRAGELMGCLPQNVLFIERGTIDGLRAQERLRRFEHVRTNMEFRRCAVRTVRLKRNVA